MFRRRVSRPIFEAMFWKLAPKWCQLQGLVVPQWCEEYHGTKEISSSSNDILMHFGVCII